MKISKITKLLPLAVAFVMATTGAYAPAGAATEATNTPQTANYSLDLQPFFDIETTSSSLSSTTSFSGNYTELTMDTALNATFQVIGNQVSQSVALSATCPVFDSEDQNATGGALYNVAEGNNAGLRIIFANSTNRPSDLTTMKTTHATASSPNAIAFTLTPTYTHEEASSNGFLNTPALSADKIVYELPNGKHTFQYVIGTTPIDSSFSTLDTNGTYTATLTLAQYTAP